MTKLNSKQSANKVTGAKIDYSYPRKTLYLHPKLMKYRNAINLNILFSLIITRSRASVSFTRNGKNHKCFYNKYDHRYYVVYSINELMNDFPGQVSHTTITNLLNTLEAEKIIYRNKKHGFIEIEITDPIACKDIRAYERGIEYSTKKPATKGRSKKLISHADQKSCSAVSNSNISNSNIYTGNTSNTQTGITKLNKNTDKNLRLRQKLVNKALDTMAKTTNEHTSNSIPKLVNTIKRYSFNSYKSYYHYFSLFFRAKKSILNKLRKKPGLTVYDFKQYKNGLTFELNPLFNTKEASHKVFKIIWHAGKLYDKSKDHKGRDRYMMHSFQNLIGTYAYNYVLDQNAENGPKIPIIDDKIAG